MTCEQTDDNKVLRICAFLHHPAMHSSRSGLYPLAEALHAEIVRYELLWEELQARSWMLGHLLRRWGNAYYGSGWNALVPWFTERRLAAAARSRNAGIVHFMWAEFASPRNPGWFRRDGGKLVGTFHCSARRQPQVLGRFKCFNVYEAVTVMSATQIPYLVQRGVPEEQIKVILHGVDTEFFHPLPSRSDGADAPLRLLMVGATERDHEFLVALMRSLPPGVCKLQVLTDPVNARFYAGLRDVSLLPRLDDLALRDAYCRADVLTMPVFDCTANNAILESMACGTPVMVNRVGGIGEYVSSSAGMIMDGKNVEAWRQKLVEWARSPAVLRDARPSARAWAERFDWGKIATEYRSLYETLVAP